MSKIINLRSLLISGAVVAPVLVFVGFAQAARYLSLTWQAITAACANTWNMFLGSLDHPSTIIIAIIAIVLGAGLLRGIFFVIWQIYKTQRLQRSMSSKKVSKHSLNEQYESLQVVDTQDSFAVTLGIWKPAIYISTGLLKQLSNQEITSVIVHEQHHRRHKHPLNNLLAHFIKSFLFFIPIMPALANSITRKQELEADSEAMRATSRASLATAILKTMAGASTNYNFPISASPFSLMADRARAVLGEQVSAVVNVTKKTILVSVIIVTAMIMLLVWPYTESANAHSVSVADNILSQAANYCHETNQNMLPLFNSGQGYLDTVLGQDMLQLFN